MVKGYLSQVKNTLKKTYYKVFRPSSYYQLDKETETRFKSQQLLYFSAMTLANIPSNIFLSILIVFYFWFNDSNISKTFLIIWLIVFMSILVGWYLHVQLVRKKYKTKMLGNIEFVISYFLTSIHSIVYASLAIYIFFTDKPMQKESILAIFLIQIGVAAAGAINAGIMYLSAVLWLVPIVFSVIFGMAFGTHFFNIEIIIGMCGFIVNMLITIYQNVELYYNQMLSEAKLQQQNELVSLLLHEYNPNKFDGTWETDSHGLLTKYSNGIKKLLNINDYNINFSGLLNQVYFNKNETLLTDFKRKLNYLFDKKVLKEKSMEFPITHNQGSYWIQLLSKPKLSASGKLLGWQGALINITDRVNYEEQLKKQANTDHLTKVFNRRGFLSALESCIAAEKPVTLALVDLDNFKEINDSYGHHVGDRVLKEFAKHVAHFCSAYAITFSRIGGDEFSLIINTEQTQEEPEDILKKLYIYFQTPLRVHFYNFYIKMSIGVAIHSTGINSAILLRNADMALYHAKSDIKNQYKYYSKFVKTKIERRATIVNDLLSAIEKGEMFIVYQPWQKISTNDTGNLSETGFEALLRWNHSTLGLISPTEFIPIAESTKVINTIGTWVIKTIFSDMTKWHQEHSVSINLSPVQIKQDNLFDTIVEYLKLLKISPHRVEFEITESILIQDEEKIKALIQKFKQYGFHVSLDDFGTGYSNFSYLTNYTFDKLKIDRSFVDQLNKKPKEKDLQIILSIIQLSKNLKINTVAEGITNEVQYEFLKKHGIDYIQGYFLSKPITRDKINAFTFQKIALDK